VNLLRVLRKHHPKTALECIECGSHVRILYGAEAGQVGTVMDIVNSGRYRWLTIELHLPGDRDPITYRGTTDVHGMPEVEVLGTKEE
jgi:hypothetical protein